MSLLRSIGARTVGLLVLVGATAGAQADLLHQRLVGTGDAYPDGGAFHSLRSRFAYENDTLYFFGRPSSSSRYNLIKQPVGGTATVLVDSTATIPGGSGTFYNMSSFAPSVSNGYVAFHNKTQGSTQHGLYLCDPSGTVSRVVDRTIPMPDFASEFGAFTGPQLHGTDVYFRATSLSPGQDGFYRASGDQFTSIVNNDTIIPGVETALTTKTDFDVDGARFYFYGGDAFDYRAVLSTLDDGATLQIHADTFTSMPGYTEWQFESMSDPRTDNGKLVWWAQSAKDPASDDFRMQGIYGDIDGQLVSLVDKYTPNPGGGNFEKIESLRGYENGIALFTGEHDRTDTGDEDGLYYVLPDGSVHLVVEEALTLDGKVIEDLLGSALYGQTAVFSVQFNDGSKAVYATVIPEPTSLLLLAIGAAVTTLRRRR